MMTGAIGYTTKLTEYVMEKSKNADIVQEQLADPSVDVISGLPFKTEEDEQISDSEKAEKVKESFANLTIAEKAEIYTNIKSVMPEDQLQATTAQYMAQYTLEQLKALAVQSYAEQMGMTDPTEIEDTVEGEEVPEDAAETTAAAE
jgi:putative ABC transport system permease protein